jgi:hypothetical protein
MSHLPADGPAPSDRIPAHRRLVVAIALWLVLTGAFTAALLSTGVGAVSSPSVNVRHGSHGVVWP